MTRHVYTAAHYPERPFWNVKFCGVVCPMVSHPNCSWRKCLLRVQFKPHCSSQFEAELRSIIQSNRPGFWDVRTAAVVYNREFFFFFNRQTWHCRSSGIIGRYTTAMSSALRKAFRR